MKKSLLFLLAAALFCFSSCYNDTEIKERIDLLEKISIQNINIQIESMKSSIASLEKTDKSLQELIAALQAQDSTFEGDIKKLRIYDESLQNDINRLREYCKENFNDLSEWVLSTFVTIKKYNETVEELASLKKSYASLNDHVISLDKQLSGVSEKLDELEKSIDESIAAVRTWVSETLKSYYTAKQTDSKIEALGNELDAKLAELSNALDTVSENVSKLMERIQSMVYVPRYDDGAVTAWYERVNYTLTAQNDTVEFRIRPADAAAKLAADKSALSIEAVYTQTRAAAKSVKLDVVSATASGDVLSVVFSGSKLSNSFFFGEEGASICLVVSDGNNDLTSEYVRMVPKASNISFVVTGITLGRDSLQLNMGDSTKLGYFILPSNADDQSVEWSSSAPEVATVSADGMVTAVAPGEAVITVTTVDGGKTASCVVTVVDPDQPSGEEPGEEGPEEGSGEGEDPEAGSGEGDDPDEGSDPDSNPDEGSSDPDDDPSEE